MAPSRASAVVRDGAEDLDGSFMAYSVLTRISQVPAAAMTAWRAAALTIVGRRGALRLAARRDSIDRIAPNAIKRGRSLTARSVRKGALLVAAATAASSAFMAPAFADTTTITMDLSIDIGTACAFAAAAPNVAFGKLGGSAAAPDKPVPIQISCSDGLAYWITASSPNDDASGNHFLKTSDGKAILYQTLWNGGTIAIPRDASDHRAGGVGSTTTLTQNILVRLPAETRPGGRPMGAYADTLTITINY